MNKHLANLSSLDGTRAGGSLASGVSRFGASFIELVVYMVLLTLFLGGMMQVFNVYRNTQAGVDKIDLLHQIRMSSFIISEKITYGSSLMFPPIDQDKTFHQLVFRNDTNEVIVLFLNEKQQLMELNLMKKQRGELFLKQLTDNTISFDVKRPRNHYVEFNLTVKDERNHEIHLANSVRLRNVMK